MGSPLLPSLGKTVQIVRGTKITYILWHMVLCRKSDIIVLVITYSGSPQERYGKFVAGFYCKCEKKNKIWAEVWWKPEADKHLWVFSDDNKESKTYGERITNCLGCGEELHRKMLTLA